MYTQIQWLNGPTFVAWSSPRFSPFRHVTFSWLSLKGKTHAGHTMAASVVACVFAVRIWGIWWFLKPIVPSGKLTVCHWKLRIYSWFTIKVIFHSYVNVYQREYETCGFQVFAKWWFSIRFSAHPFGHGDSSAKSQKNVYDTARISFYDDIIWDIWDC